ncbi:MAG: FAD-dependent oxidoreductase [Betaproteobacteria bacterium]|nr:FAD-dependent oxidoreductase [Betaproteobacteria bacterium]
MRQRVAVIGSGIAGLSAAHYLNQHVDLSLFEAGSYFGGHTHTVDVTLPSAQGTLSHGVDTGFLVYNQRTYPGLISLFESLNIRTAASDMSFSVQARWDDTGKALEWNGANLNSVFAQRSNLLRPRFWGLFRDIMRFNQLATDLAQSGQADALTQPLQQFLDEHRFGSAFRQGYLLPMLGCIWSCPTTQMLQFPVATMVRFCDNHGLLQVNNRPPWFTVAGGAKHYVQAITDRISDKRLNTPVLGIARDAQGVQIRSAQGVERFDQVVLATHADQSLALLERPSSDEQALLGAIRFQANRAVLHTDTRVMPQRRLAWAAWNYQRTQDDSESARVCLHYWLNRLQPLPFKQDVIVSLNPASPIDPATILGSYDYDHPVFDLPAIAAQNQLPRLQGQHRTWYAGAWMRYGFHEDGYQAGLAAAKSLLAQHTHTQEALA